LQAHNAGIWEELEDAVAGVRSAGGFRPGLTRRTARIWVYTGPVLEDSGAAISAKQVAVPRALWKAAVWFTPAGQAHACAWIIPHDPDLDRHRWKEFATTLGSLEALAGVTLVPEDPGRVSERCDLDEVIEAWPWGQAPVRGCTGEGPQEGQGDRGDRPAQGEAPGPSRR